MLQGAGCTMSLHTIEPEYVDANPLDLLEQVADMHNWPFDRSHEQELNLSISGEWRDYHISLNWREDIGGLHMACLPDVRVPPEKVSAVLKLLPFINEHLWSGHFDLWSEDGTIMFRDSLLLSGGATATPEQCDQLVNLAMEACERYYPAFQYVIWAGKTPEEAVAACMFDTQGSA